MLTRTLQPATLRGFARSPKVGNPFGGTKALEKRRGTTVKIGF